MKKLTTSQQLAEWCGMVSVAHYCANGIWESKVYLDNGEIRHCHTTTRKLNRMTLDEAIVVGFRLYLVLFRGGFVGWRCVYLLVIGPICIGIVDQELRHIISRDRGQFGLSVH